MVIDFLRRDESAHAAHMQDKSAFRLTRGER